MEEFGEAAHARDIPVPTRAVARSERTFYRPFSYSEGTKIKQRDSWLNEILSESTNHRGNAVIACKSLFLWFGPIWPVGN